MCRDYIEPSTAAIVHGKLGLSGYCLNFDLGNACLAFMNAMEVAGQMIERGAIEYALVVDGENSQYVQTKTLERLAQADVSLEQFRREFATLTLGSGGVAMLLGAKDKVNRRTRPEMGSASLQRSGVAYAEDKSTTWRHTRIPLRRAEACASHIPAHRDVLLVTD